MQVHRGQSGLDKTLFNHNVKPLLNKLNSKPRFDDFLSHYNNSRPWNKDLLYVVTSNKKTL